MGRTDTATRVIEAAPATVFAALVDPDALVTWLPPQGMRGSLHAFEPRPNGRFEMTLSYESQDQPRRGKTSEHSDVVRGRFLEVVPPERVVQLVEFESDDPAFAGAMRMTWTLAPVREGTLVTVRAEDVPQGIRAEDHEAGMASTLANLAAFTE